MAPRNPRLTIKNPASQASHPQPARDRMSANRMLWRRADPQKIKRPEPRTLDLDLPLLKALNGLAANCRSEIVEVEAFWLPFFVVGNGEFRGAFRGRVLFLLQFALGLLLNLLLPFFLPCPFLRPLRRGCARASSHDLPPGNEMRNGRNRPLRLKMRICPATKKQKAA
jgi:hypothetical protein